MFDRKYVFEGRLTRYQRYAKSCLLVLLCLFILVTFLGGMLYLTADKYNKEAQQELYGRSPDLIIVLTGDKGRLPYAFEKAIEYNVTNIFITGVHNKNTVEKLITPYKQKLLLDADNLEIDYQAHNTVENIISIVRYLNENSEMKKVLIISHDYHLLRVRMLLGTLKGSDLDASLYYSGVASELSWRTVKLYYLEVFKLLRAMIFITIWPNVSE